MPENNNILFHNLTSPTEGERSGALVFATNNSHKLDERTAKYTEGKQVKKIIVVPGRIINIVV